MEPQTPQERAKAKRLYKAYRWTWPMYWALGVKQGWKCAICGRSAKNSALNGQLDGLNVDHVHFSVEAIRTPIQHSMDFKKWIAGTTVQGVYIARQADSKVAAIAMVREAALPLSVRGLLCPGRHGKAGSGCCNRLLGRVDNPDWLEKARNYLLDPPAKGVV